jgi:toxin ParE1/3/4
MSWRLRRTQIAENDLQDIWTYIAEESPRSANKVVRKIMSAFDGLAEYPARGRAIPDISADHHLLVIGRYLLIYHLDERHQIVTLVRVIHGARDWLALFDGVDEVD